MGEGLNFNPMILVFFVGYLMITIENVIHINKATIALLMGVICWILQFGNHNITPTENLNLLSFHLGDISQIVLFLIGALTVVEIINAHNGFKIIADSIRIRSKKKMFWAVGIITFFLSSILDNLTTTIVMISFLQKIIEKREDRLIFGGGIVIAANAGGAWTPIGDVTTTMLWIGNQISTISIMRELFLPSIACFIVSFFVLGFTLKGEMEFKKNLSGNNESQPYGQLIFLMGVILLIFVPIFKTITGLPPFMAILFAVSVLWFVTDVLHFKYFDREHLRVPHVLSKIDLSSVLFFLGILLCINALESAGILSQMAHYLDRSIGDKKLIAISIGLASSIVDNVPLVAAAMGMYDLSTYPTDSPFWNLIAFCAGTGGSILIFGSAAGVVFMSLEKVSFSWYFKKITIPSLLGFLVGSIIYIYLPK